MSYVRLFLVFFFAMLGHWAWTTHGTLWGFAPQILLVLTVAIGGRQGPVAAMICGFGWGIFLDVMRAHLFGGSALALTLIGYTTGSARRQIDVVSIAPQCVIVFFVTWGYFLFMTLLGAIFMRELVWVGWETFLANAFFNCLLVPIAVFLVEPERR